MAEWAYALASVAELKQVLTIDSAQVGQDSVLETVLKRASEAVEAYLGRHVVTRGSITEYHSPDRSLSEIWLLQWPVISITTVKEGGWVNGSWTADVTLLTTSGDYLSLSTEDGARLIRLSAGQPWSWPAGFDAVQVVYSAGYATTSVVPGALKDVCLSLASRKYSQIRRGGDFSAQTVSDAGGSVTRFLPTDLLYLEQQQIFGWRNLRQSTTGRAA